MSNLPITPSRRVQQLVSALVLQGFVLVLPSESRPDGEPPCRTTAFDYNGFVECTQNDCQSACEIMTEEVIVYGFGLVTGRTCKCPGGPNCCHAVIIIDPDGSGWKVVPSGQCNQPGCDQPAGGCNTVGVVGGGATAKCLGGP